MQIKLLRNGLIAITAAAIALIASVGVWALLGNSVKVPEVEIPNLGPATKITATNTPKEAKSFDGLWNLSLQEPRNTVRAAQAKPMVVQSVAGFAIKLVGTVIEPTQSLGLFRDGRGAFDLKGAGQPLELIPAGVEVASIEPGLATLRYEGREHKLDVKDGAAFTTGVNRSMTPPPPSPEFEPEMPPVGMMTPMNPNEVVPSGEEDIFAPLPRNMDPTLQDPETAPSTLMEAKP